MSVFLHENTIQKIGLTILKEISESYYYIAFHLRKEKVAFKNVIITYYFDWLTKNGAKFELLIHPPQKGCITQETECKNKITSLSLI